MLPSTNGDGLGDSRTRRLVFDQLRGLASGPVALACGVRCGRRINAALCPLAPAS